MEQSYQHDQKRMRSIEYIVLHCTATDQETKVSAILRYWREKLGWKHPGYHFIIDFDGHITQLQPLSKPSNGVRGYNAHSVHISYVGGIDRRGKAKDTRTPAQYSAMQGLVKALHAVYPKAKVRGHRDFPRVNKNCPSFEVKEYLKEIEL